MTPKWSGSTLLQEDPNSPQWKFGDQVSCTRVFRGQYNLCYSSAPLKGAFGTGIMVGYKVDESTVGREKGGRGALTIQYLWAGGTPPQGAALPPDEMSIDQEKVERSLEKHPRYTGTIPLELVEALRAMLHTTDDETLAGGHDLIDSWPNVDEAALANELYDKLARGFSHYVIYSPVVRFLTYSWIAPGGLTEGGFRENPPGAPLTPPPGLDWLREADRVTWNGNYWTVERRWFGGPDLDADIYPAP